MDMVSKKTCEEWMVESIRLEKENRELKQEVKAVREMLETEMGTTKAWVDKHNELEKTLNTVRGYVKNIVTYLEI